MTNPMLRHFSHPLTVSVSVLPDGKTCILPCRDGEQGGVGLQSKERKGSNFAAQRREAIERSVEA